MREESSSLPPRQPAEYLEVPLHWPRLLALPVLICTLGALVASYMVPKMYRSSTLILVESDKVPDSFVPKMTTENTKRRLFTLKQQILSRTRLERIIRELNPYPKDVAAGKSMSKIVESMRDAITIRTKGTDAFLVEYVHRDPVMAMRVANRLASLFIEEVTVSRTQQVEDAYDFIQKQVQEARTKLEANEEAVRVYKQKHLGTLPEQIGANLATLQRLQLEQQDLSDSIRAAEGRLDVMRKTLADQAQASGAATLDPRAELAKLRSQLATLRSRYTDRHPDVRALADRIARLEKRQATQGEAGAVEEDQDVENAPSVLTAKADLRNLVEKRDEVDQKIAAFQHRVEQTPRTEEQLALLTRDSKKLSENYLNLLGKKFEAERAEKLEARWKGENFKTLDPAGVPERPFFPSHRLFVAVGLALGLALGVGLTFAADLLDHSLKNVLELEATLSYPVLAIIPHVPRGRGRARGSIHRSEDAVQA